MILIRPLTEKILREEKSKINSNFKPEENCTYYKPKIKLSDKTRIANIKPFLSDLISREPTEEELETYIKLFKSGKTNIWSYADSLLRKDGKDRKEEQKSNDEKLTTK